MDDAPRFDYKVAEEVAKRLAVFFDGLPPEQVKAALEELIDDYTSAQFGTTIMQEMRKVKHPAKGQSVCVQTFASGRALVVSSYGFSAKTDSKCKCGRAFLVLDECTREDFEKGMEELG